MMTYASNAGSRKRLAYRFLGLALLVLVGSHLSFADAIHDAARKNKVKQIKALLQQDPKLVDSVDGNGNTPLHEAALHGNVEAATALLAAGANVNAKDSYGPFTPGDLWTKVFSSSNHQDPVTLLNVHGPDTKYMKNGYTPLDLAIFSVRHKQMVQLLVSKGANVNAQAASGATPLFWAVLRDQKDDAEYLLAHGANVNLTDAYGDTILDCALRLQFGSIVKLLVEHGADVNAVDQSQHRPLYYALQMDDTSYAAYLRKHGAHE
ncbi:MAG TPA: ankyrin repeat domain-containing protein [Terracidiphilus sp.]|nr:ankyrin repeat domain-containing protein [Terracidiphilus sp.]